MKNFVQPGNVITIKGQTTPVVSGHVYDIGGMIGLATGSLTAADIAGGTDYWEMALGGVYAFEKGDATYTFGADAKFDPASGGLLATGSITAGKMIDETATHIHVLLNGRGEPSGY